MARLTFPALVSMRAIRWHLPPPDDPHTQGLRGSSGPFVHESSRIGEESNGKTMQVPRSVDRGRCQDAPLPVSGPRSALSVPLAVLCLIECCGPFTNRCPHDTSKNAKSYRPSLRPNTFGFAAPNQGYSTKPGIGTFGLIVVRRMHASKEQTVWNNNQTLNNRDALLLSWPFWRRAQEPVLGGAYGSQRATMEWLLAWLVQSPFSLTICSGKS